MGLFTGKKGVIMGVANDRSLGTGIAKALFSEGAELAFSHLPDDKGKMLLRCQKAIEDCDPKLIAPCDVNKDEDVEAFFNKVKACFGSIDFLVHSIAYAPSEDIKCPTIEASRQGFLTAMESSCYSFITTAKHASALMEKEASLLTLSYYGGEKAVPGYNLMGIAKAALECSIKYLAFDLGSRGIRVNGISAGPVKTLAASAVGDFSDMLNLHSAIAPLGKNVSQMDVGRAAAFLLSPWAAGVSGELLHVDGGYHAMGGMGHALQAWGVKPKPL